MNSINIIVAMNQDNVIGMDNKLPWDLREDLQNFRKLTLNSVVIMGRKTYESIGMPLPNRENIIISNNLDYVAPYTHIYASIKQAILYAKRLDKPIFIIGGGEIYNNTLSIADYLFITEVEYSVDLNSENIVYFPKIDVNKWELVDRKSYISKNKIKYHFCKYQKRTKYQLNMDVVELEF
jgi:dihydrofolate reductase